jgi:hypothetical protein
MALVLLASVCLGSSAMAADRSQAPAAAQHQTVKKKVRKTADAKPELLSYFGVSENMILSGNAQQSQNVANLGKNTGFNFWRVNDYFHLPGAPDNPNNSLMDPVQLCNAAKALVGAGIKTLMLTYMPTSNLGYPQTDSDQVAVHTFMDRDFGVLYGVGPDVGCADGDDGKPALQVMVQLGNEMNISTFCQPQTDTDHLACARLTVAMQTSLYGFIKGEEEPKFGVSIKVVGASLASHHTPWPFLQQYKHQMQVTASQCVCMDIYDYHAYAQWGSCVQPSGVNMYKALVVNGRSVFGKVFGTSKLPIIYGEWAIQTLMLNSQGYFNYEPLNCQVVNENQQLTAWQQVIPVVQSQPVLGIVTELLCDEQDLLKGFQSGLYTYGCQRPKQTEPAIAQLIHNARVQDIPAGNTPQATPKG